MPISTDMIVRIAHADVAMDSAFPQSIAHWNGEDALWRSEDEENYAWQIQSGDCDALLLGKGDAVIIDGDCSKKVSVPEGGIIHIYGNLHSMIDVGGFTEVIVTGDVGPNGLICAEDDCYVFVGGRFAGSLQLTESSKLWIGSDFDGTLKTGCPYTRIFIGGDLKGQILPNESVSLLNLTVFGFAANATLHNIMDCNYTTFQASIAESDLEPGIYPLNGHQRRPSGGNSFNRWCVKTCKRERT